MALGETAGGTTPYVVTWLTAETGNNVAPAYYVVAGRDRVALDDPDHSGRPPGARSRKV